jgi:hypothetical protein
MTLYARPSLDPMRWFADGRQTISARASAIAACTARMLAGLKNMQRTSPRHPSMHALRPVAMWRPRGAEWHAYCFEYANCFEFDHQLS